MSMSPVEELARDERFERIEVEGFSDAGVEDLEVGSAGALEQARARAAAADAAPQSS